jgi:hypothetical protein
MTQTDKHTPKLDWYVAAPDTIRGQEPRIRDTMPAVRDNNGGKEICVLTNYNQSHAQLIAAAPELLEALQLVVACYDDDGNLIAEYQDQDAIAFEKAHAAIAKATGKAGE